MSDRDAAVLSHQAPAVERTESTRHADEGFNPLRPSVGLTFWSGVTFVVLLIVLWKFAWKPILGKIEERESKIKGDIDGAEKARLDAETTLKQHEARLAQAAQEARETVEAARVRAEQAAASIAAQAKADAEATLARARAQIESDKERAVADIKAAVVDLSMAITRDVVKRTSGQEEHSKLADELLQHVRAGGRG